MIHLAESKNVKSLKLIVARSYSKQIARNVNKKCCQHFLQCNIYLFRTTKKHSKSPLRFREIKIYRINNNICTYIICMHNIGHLFLFNNVWNIMFVPIDFRILGIIRIVAITLWIVDYLSKFVSRLKLRNPLTIGNKDEYGEGE